MPVLVAALVSGLLVLAAYAGSGALALAVVGVQALLAYGVVTARRSGADPRPAGEATTMVRAGGLIAVTGAASVVAQRLADPDPSGPTIAPVLWVLGPAVVLAMLIELARRDGREGLVESLASTVTGVVLAGMLGFLAGAEDLAPLREVAVAFAAGGALLGAVGWWLACVRVPRWRWPARVVALLLVAGAGVALWLVAIPHLHADQQLAVGGAVAVTGLVGAGAGRRLGVDTASRAALTSAVALALTAPTVYLAGRLLFW